MIKGWMLALCLLAAGCSTPEARAAERAAVLLQQIGLCRELGGKAVLGNSFGEFYVQYCVLDGAAVVIGAEK